MCCHSVICEVIHHPKLLIQEMSNIRIKPVYKGKAMIFPSIVLQEEKEIYKSTNEVSSLCHLYNSTFLLSDSYDFILFQKFAFWILHSHHLLHSPRILDNEYHVATLQSWISLAYRRKNPKFLLKCWGNLLLLCHSDQYHSMWDWPVSLKTFSSWRLWCLGLSRDGVFTSSQDVQSLGKVLNHPWKNW